MPGPGSPLSLTVISSLSLLSVFVCLSASSPPLRLIDFFILLHARNDLCFAATPLCVSFLRFDQENPIDVLQEDGARVEYACFARVHSIYGCICECTCLCRTVCMRAQLVQFLTVFTSLTDGLML